MSEKLKQKKMYIIYDGRAAYGDVDSATVMCCEETLKEAKKSCKMFGESVVYEYDDVNNKLSNGVMVYHYVS